MSFVKIEGNDFYHEGKKVHLHGVNIGNCLFLEGFMLGLPSVHTTIHSTFKRVLGQKKYDAFFNAYVKSYFAKEDAAFMKSIGVNTIRLPFHYGIFEDDNNPGIIKKEGFELINNFVKIASDEGIWVMLDMHTAPGSAGPDPSGNCEYGDVRFWKEKNLRDRAVNIWKEIASYYAQNEIILGYDILCEPITDKHDILSEYYKRCVEAIRVSDKNHIIALEGAEWARDFKAIDISVYDENTLPTFHVYLQHYEEINTLKTFPTDEAKIKIIDDKLEAVVAEICDGMPNRPVIAGEFGFSYKLPTNDAYYEPYNRLLSLYEKKGFSYLLWSYKDAGAMGLVYPSENTPWQKFLNDKEIVKINKSLKTFTCPNFVYGNTQKASVYKPLKKMFPNLENETILRGMQVMNATTNRLALEEVLLKLESKSEDELTYMARSFSFDSCLIREKTQAMLSEHFYKMN